MDEAPRLPITIDFECHIDHIVRAFVASSDRVRYVIIAITVASILIFTGHYNGMKESWFNSRLSLARLALDIKAWQNTPDRFVTPEEKAARSWAEQKKLQREEDVRDQIRLLEEFRVDHFLILRMPIFGISFDVNDLGLLGSIALLTILLMLVFAMTRQAENLYLSLWKVKDIWRAEKCPDRSDSAANLVYHSLAMSQHFSNPPTLARWKIGRLQSLTNILLLVPLLVQGWGLWLDWSTRDLGMILNARGTIVSLVIQTLALVIMAVLTVCCYLFIRANNIRWNNTFLLINQRLIDGNDEDPKRIERIDPSDSNKLIKARNSAPFLVWLKVRTPDKRYHP